MNMKKTINKMTNKYNPNFSIFFFTNKKKMTILKLFKTKNKSVVLYYLILYCWRRRLLLLLVVFLKWIYKWIILLKIGLCIHYSIMVYALLLHQSISNHRSLSDEELSTRKNCLLFWLVGPTSCSFLIRWWQSS